jgi:replicative superfamily II helicase
VADFLQVDQSIGLYVFDSRFRPVPLKQTFIGVKERHPLRRAKTMNALMFDKAGETVKTGHQVLVFVHSRKETIATAKYLVT